MGRESGNFEEHFLEVLVPVSVVFVLECQSELLKFGGGLVLLCLELTSNNYAR